MAHHSPPTSNLDIMNRSHSNLSLNSNVTVDSARLSSNSIRSSTSSRRRRGLLGKLESGFQSLKRRFTPARTSLTEMETKILSAMTDFTREEVLQWHEKFITECPNGYMTRKQFVAMYKSLCPTADADRFARHVFRAFDLDQSNTVDFREFLLGVSMTSTTSSIETKLEWTFHVFDVDGNGLLTRRECLEVIECIVRFNQTSQGETSESHLEQVILIAKRAMMKIFDKAIDTHNDKLTVAQFVRGCSEDSLISQLLAPGATSALTNTSVSQVDNT